MEIKKKAVCGTFSSNDAFVTVEPAKELILSIESPVYYEFGEQIEKVVRETLQKMEVTQGSIQIEDKGALDCTIIARVETAIRRAQ